MHSPCDVTVTEFFLYDLNRLMAEITDDAFALSAHDEIRFGLAL